MAQARQPLADSPVRLCLTLRGAVQGVGFRPFVYRSATDLGLGGWVRNDAQGVRIEVEGPRSHLESFRRLLREELPPRAAIHEWEESWQLPEGQAPFGILHSEAGEAPTAMILADGAPCAACVREIRDPGDRRYRYPFTNCTDCGPRFSIITGLPYDRPLTTMHGFAMCAACRREYEDPLDRRFHAQPSACRACGPRLHLFDAAGRSHCHGDEALVQAGRAVCEGRILAFKGVGGFVLVCDAEDASVVARLRERKQRDAKPLALLVADLESARELCEVSSAAARELTSSEAPIVLLPKRASSPVAPAVAPGLDRLGVMLPSSPLHHLLLAEVGRPVVATSGNRSDEPICIDDEEARHRLGGIADLFLGHDRPIARHVDDSVECLVRDRVVPIRRARGQAPLPVRLTSAVPPLLAVGGHLKNTIALAVGRHVYLSQHIGDLDTVQARSAFEGVIADFLRMYPVQPVAIAHDLHPDHASTHWAQGLRRRVGPPWAELARVPLVAVQHHHAHLAACLAENGHEGGALGVIWDGTGYGPDGTVWGGEFLEGDARSVGRVAHLRPFRLPGADAATQEPRRVALALLWDEEGEAAFDRMPEGTFTREERRVFGQMLASGFQAPLTTSMGRLFDGVAALLGLCTHAAYEAQAPIAVEVAHDSAESGAYELPLGAGTKGTLELDWRPLLQALLADRSRGVAPAIMAARFQNALVEGLVAVARHVANPTVALSGGCFLNRVLLGGATEKLEAVGFRVLAPRHVPPGDGGIALGQVAVAAAGRRSN